MDAREVLTEAFERLPELVRAAVDGLTPEELHWAPGPGANTVGWLVWHLTRMQDGHVAELMDAEQVYVRDGWAARFGLDPDPADTGYAHSAEQVARVRPESAEVLVGYFDAVFARTRDYLGGLSAKDLDRVVDESWDPPVTLGVRLVSVLNDDDQHVGQAAYVRGLVRSG
ncbi:mycothiol transferase [Phytohabitans kaempferiae]|uniref:DinB family protein n=1 Tax=Phytohabitans kaempferiae TaxID=1620943 RepID=A0ABV6MGL3_9ACTN